MFPTAEGVAVALRSFSRGAAAGLLRNGVLPNASVARGFATVAHSSVRQRGSIMSLFGLQTSEPGLHSLLPSGIGVSRSLSTSVRRSSPVVARFAEQEGVPESTLRRVTEACLLHSGDKVFGNLQAMDGTLMMVAGNPRDYKTGIRGEISQERYQRVSVEVSPDLPMTREQKTRGLGELAGYLGGIPDTMVHMREDFIILACSDKDAQAFAREGVKAFGQDYVVESHEEGLLIRFETAAESLARRCPDLQVRQEDTRVVVEGAIGNTRFLSTYGKSEVQEDQRVYKSRIPIKGLEEMSAAQRQSLSKDIKTLCRTYGLSVSVDARTELVTTEMGDRVDLIITVLHDEGDDLSPLGKAVATCSGNLHRPDVINQALSVALASVDCVDGETHKPESMWIPFPKSPKPGEFNESPTPQVKSFTPFSASLPVIF